MKTNYYLRTAVVLLVCLMFSLCTITGTLARYTATSSTGEPLVIRPGIFRVMVTTGTDVQNISAPGDTQVGLQICGNASPNTITSRTGGVETIKVWNQSEVAVTVKLTLNPPASVVDGFTLTGLPKAALTDPEWNQDVTLTPDKEVTFRLGWEYTGAEAADMYSVGSIKVEVRQVHP